MLICEKLSLSGESFFDEVRSISVTTTRYFDSYSKNR